MNPDELLFAETHEWAAIQTENGAKVATVGVSAFAVEQMTDLVFLALPAVGRQLKSGESFGEIESVKAVSDLFSPVAGEVVAVNSSLPDQLELLSSDPYGRGWIIKVRVADETSVSRLMDHATYQKKCAADH